jgi:hypothetical protein
MSDHDEEVRDLWNGLADPGVEYLKCAADAAYFTDTYCMIDDAQDNSGTGAGVCRFRLWPAQTRVTWSLMSERLVVILKARQLGISWTVCSYALWKSLFQANQPVIFVSKSQKEADELLRRLKALYNRLPSALKEYLPRPFGDSARDFRLTNGSFLRSMPATPNAVVSYTPALLVIDEAAYIHHAEKLISNARPAIEPNGQMIILSTANGVGGAFHSIWSDAEAGLNGFHPIFLPWWSRPGYTAEMIERAASQSNDPGREIAEKYPSNSTEAFVGSGRSRFPAEWIKAQAAFAQDPVSDRNLPDALVGIPGVRFYRGGGVGEKFAICADVAEGIDDGNNKPDFSAAHVISQGTCEQVCVIHGRWETDRFAEYLLRLASVYGQPEILVERNNHGHAVLSILKRERYRRIGKGHDGKMGWLTNEVTREQSVDYLASHLRDRAVVIRDRPTLGEMTSFQVGRRGYSCAVQGAHDDLVMSLAIYFGWVNHGLLRKIGSAVSTGANPLHGYRG